MEEISPLQKDRLSFQPRLPKLLSNLSRAVAQKGKATASLSDSTELKAIFPLTYGQETLHFTEGSTNQLHPSAKKVGVVFSGGQASGGHNVITGLHDALVSLHPESTLIGFLGGPSGILNCKTRSLDAIQIALYRNQGGFDLIGSGRTKIETDEQLQAALMTVQSLELDGLVVIGGDDSNTNAAVLAEYFLKNGCKTVVIGVPKTIDGDLKNEQIEVSFGFDTACKVFSESIGNILRDCLSAKKYYHFIRLMGRSASHITLECALQTHPNMALIGEEIAAQGKTLAQVSHEIVEVVAARSEAGKNYGVILVPEGLIEFIPEVGELISELNAFLSPNQPHSNLLDQLFAESEKIDYISSHLSDKSRDTFKTLPAAIQLQLLMDRDPHGNVQVSRIDTEQLLIETVSAELKKLKEEGSYKGAFNAQPHFFGYEGRAALPSNFDAEYCYALGYGVALLIQASATGYMCSIQELSGQVETWKVSGVPLTMMMNLEKRHGKSKPVIKKALVKLDGKPFQFFKERRQRWAMQDSYRFPGPIQFHGASELTDAVPLTLTLEKDAIKG